MLFSLITIKFTNLLVVIIKIKQECLKIIINEHFFNKFVNFIKTITNFVEIIITVNSTKFKEIAMLITIVLQMLIIVYLYFEVDFTKVVILFVIKLEFVVVIRVILKKPFIISLLSVMPAINKQAFIII